MLVVSQVLIFEVPISLTTIWASLNCARITFTNTNIGTDKTIPVTPHKYPQNTRPSITTTVFRERLLPISLGSIIFQILTLLLHESQQG